MATATVKKNQATEEEIYEGVKLAEVDKRRLRKFLGSKTADVKALLDEYRAKNAEQKAAGTALVHCGVCNALLPADQQECPVCGDVDEVDSLDTSKAIVVPPEDVEVLPSVAQQVAELDRSVEKCRGYIANLMESHWDLGRELFHIQETKSYKQRVDGTGKPAYKSWEDFCKAEIGMTGMHAVDAIKVSSLFTRDEVRQIGFTKLRVVAKTSVQDQARLLEMAKENVTLRELIKAKKTLPGYVERGPGGKVGPAARKPSAAKPPTAETATPQPVKGGVSIFFKMGKVELKMERDPKSGKMRCREELMNAVVTYYEFDPKTSVLKITREREE